MVIGAYLLHISCQQLNVLLFVVLHPLHPLLCYRKWRFYKKRYQSSLTRIRDLEPDPSRLPRLRERERAAL